MIIDAHHHYVPLAFFEKFADPSAPTRRTTTITFNSSLYKTDDHLRAMDFAGVDMAVITLSNWNVEGPDVCRQVNEAMAEDLIKYGDRFLVAGAVPVADPEAAVREIDYMLGELKLNAIALLTSQSQTLTPSNKDHMWPIYAKAVEYDVPIFWHPHLLPYGTETDCTINRSIGRAFDIGRAILRIMYDVYPEFPEVKMVMPHLGGCFLGLKGRANAFFEPREDLGVPVPEAIKMLPKTPLEKEELGYKEAFDDLFDRFYIDGAGSGGWIPATEFGFKTVRHDRLVFGIDYPFEAHAGRDYKYYLDAIDGLDIPDESKKAFLGGNLARLMKLE